MLDQAGSAASFQKLGPLLQDQTCVSTTGGLPGLVLTVHEVDGLGRNVLEGPIEHNLATTRVIE